MEDRALAVKWYTWRLEAQVETYHGESKTLRAHSRNEGESQAVLPLRSDIVVVPVQHV